MALPHYDYLPAWRRNAGQVVKLGEMERVSRRHVVLAGLGVLPAAVAACTFGSAPQASSDPTRTTSESATTARTNPSPTDVPPTATAVPPTPTPAPTPVPEPRFYAIEGGTYYAETGFTVRDEPGGPRFWSEFGRQGGVDGLGLPTSRAFDSSGADGAPQRVQLFRNGWLGGAPDAAPVKRGDGDAPEAPAQALEREDRPDMAFIGRVDVNPKQCRQGSTIVLKVWSTAAASASCNFEGREYPLAREGEAFVGLFGVHRMGVLGARPLRITLVDSVGRRVVRNDAADTVTVVDGQYPTEDIVVDDQTVSILDPNEINKEEALLNGLMSQWNPERYWKGPWVSPMGDVPLSSDFGVHRSLNGVPQNWAHEGTDFEVDTGDPIKVAADGKVVLVQKLHVRGNVVIVDHGWGVFTGYFICSSKRWSRART